MVMITFPDRETVKRSLAFLTGRLDEKIGSACGDTARLGR